jgi:hypothetical protein
VGTRFIPNLILGLQFYYTTVVYIYFDSSKYTFLTPLCDWNFKLIGLAIQKIL